MVFFQRDDVYIFGQYIRGNPEILTVIYIAKYILIFATLLFVLYHVVYKAKNIKNEYNLIFLLFFLGTSSYILARVFIGQIAVTAFFYPFIFSIPLIYIKYSKQNLNIAYIIIIILFLLNASSVYVLNDIGAVQREHYDYEYFDDTTQWAENKVPKGSIIVSDVLSHGWLLTYNTYNNIYKKEELLELNVFSEKHLYLIYYKQKVNSNPYIIINYRLPYIQMPGWRIFKNFNNFKDIIDSNTNLYKLYSSTSKISIYYSK
jgi:hypothetical protein